MKESTKPLIILRINLTGTDLYILYIVNTLQLTSKSGFMNMLHHWSVHVRLSVQRNTTLSFFKRIFKVNPFFKGISHSNSASMGLRFTLLFRNSVYKIYKKHQGKKKKARGFFKAAFLSPWINLGQRLISITYMSFSLQWTAPLSFL